MEHFPTHRPRSRPAGLPSDDVLVEAYIGSCIHRREPHAAASSEDVFRDLSAHDPEHAWRFLCLLIERVPLDAVPDVGVGELENFLHDHAPAFIERIEQRAAADSRFLLALSNVWLTRGALPPAIEERLHRGSRGTLEIIDTSEEERWTATLRGDTARVEEAE